MRQPNEKTVFYYVTHRTRIPKENHRRTRVSDVSHLGWNQVRQICTRRADATPLAVVREAISIYSGTTKGTLERQMGRCTYPVK